MLSHFQSVCCATKMKLLVWGLLMSSCSKMSPIQHYLITKYLIAIIYCHSKFMVKKQIIEWLKILFSLQGVECNLISCMYVGLKNVPETLKCLTFELYEWRRCCVDWHCKVTSLFLKRESMPNFRLLPHILGNRTGMS